MKFVEFIKNLYTEPKIDKRFPKINVSWSGSVSADTDDILNSENAKKQIADLKKTKIVQELKKEQEKSLAS